ncbi:thiamine-phosphate kinase [Actinocorallia longicatena]|uniref:Thiamine-monophosphate kinase n=1 Tax=Actinocorallia longicatena TaxID=111803 RepID=A0ABP6Q4M6_9ACTN
MISRIVARFPQGPEVLLGPGDDAAVLAHPDGRSVATMDLLVEGRHFRTDWSGAYDIGRKAAAQNLADVVAMGARPTALLIGVGLPGRLDVAWAEALGDGLRDECAVVGASIVGGDTVSAETITVAVTALGDLGGRAPLTRSGARPGDVVAVRGGLGRSAAGLRLLLAAPVGAGEAGAFEEWIGGLPERERALVAAHRRPAPPYTAGEEARTLGATALLDVSDGLVQDLGHICRASGVAIELAASALPAAGGVTAEDLLTGGEDHAFAGTFPAEAALPAEWRVVGRVTRGAGVTVDGNVPGRGGWDHFGV